jgi:hypothetical protein
MLTFLGVLIILFAVTMVVVYMFSSKEDKFEERSERNRFGETETRRVKVSEKAPAFILLWNMRNSLLAGLFGLFLIFSGMSFIFAKEGHQYYVLTPTGSRTVITTPGIKFVVPFSKVQEWSKYIDIMAVKLDKNGEPVEDTKGIEGVIYGGVKVMFIDRATADVYISARFEIPSDETAFIRLVEIYKTPENLVKNTLLKTISEQLTNVTFMYSADDYVSGAATDYKMTIEDALKNGGYVVKKVEVRDTIYAETLLIDSLVVNKPRQIREIRTLVKNEKIFENGIPKRIQHEINANQVITAQVIVSDVKLEDKFMEKLTQQRDISAEKIIEIQKIETARAAQQRIVAEGERDKAKERVDQEKAQVAKLIAIETLVKEEESKRQLAQIAVQTADLESKAKKIQADAEAYQNKQLVSAGLTPQEKAQIDKETKIGVAAEISKMKFPQVMIIGGDQKNGNTNPIEALIGANMAKQLLEAKK